MFPVTFHSEHTDFSISNEAELAQWLHTVCSNENQQLKEVAIIFCSDQYLLELNKQHLNHDYYTDVITFDYTDENGIAGDVFISIDRVRENAASRAISLSDELHRIIVHGTLHLLGYTDGTSTEKEQMTAKEDFYLSLRSF